MHSTNTLFAAAALLATVNAALDPIVIKGSKFFYKTNGTQFYVKGVAYQQGAGASGSVSNTTASSSYTDPLADLASCTRDVPYLRRLGTNTIRTYAIDPTKDHSGCMALLDAAGIYVISDLSEPSQSINRNDPLWNTALYTRYTSVIDSLQNYTNVIGFFAGNEVSNSAATSNATAYVKAAVRDMKSYISAKGYRSMGVGYAADDDATSRANVANYLNCGSTNSSIDFWGYNIYEWCSPSTYTTSGYDQRTAEFSNYTVPTFFAEYGCNTVNGVESDAENRPFTEVGTLYGPQMNDVFSGGIVYQYFEDVNDYGLVSISGNTVTPLQPEFSNLATQIAAVSTLTSGLNMASYTPTNTVARSCPTVNANWQAASALPPTPNAALCQCMVRSLSCVAKSSVATTSYGTLFNQVCGYNGGAACNGINAFPNNGTYGAYSMCDAASQLSFVMDQYYKSQKSASTACDFGGAAQIQAPSTASTCSAILAQAGTAGTGAVTSLPSGTAASSGSASSAAASSSRSAANGNTVGASFISGWTLSAYVAAAMLTGAGMIAL